MGVQPLLIFGSEHSDNRGTIHFVNDFDMSQVKRFYRIDHPDVSIIRAWRGHQIEQRWFNVIQGSFLVRLIKIDNWVKPDPSLPQISLTLKAKENSVLHIPKGYATGMQALEKDSGMIVFSDYGIENANIDNHLYPSEYFGKWEK